MNLRVRPTSTRKDLGDFQTPPALVSKILGTLERTGDSPVRVLEPTCGVGRFLDGLIRRSDSRLELKGFEIQPDHAATARQVLTRPGVDLEVQLGDLFQVDLANDLTWRTNGPLLVVGNLPWVTIASLGASGGSSGPARSNQGRGVRGINALTGSSNFDISEAIWLKLIRELAPQKPTIALLCKTAVARAILGSIHDQALPITRATLWRVDAHHWFGAAVDACLLRVEVGSGPPAQEAPVFTDLDSLVPESTLGLGSGRMIADLATYRTVDFADGVCPLQWRQGVKHDASPLMELITQPDGSLRNKRGEVVEVEGESLYPLLKGTDLAGSRRARPRLAVVVTQHRLGEETRDLELTRPRLWAYLTSHAEDFARRKSSIYRGRPPFSMFGIGAYSFAPYKVAISGLHKSPRFRLVEPVNGRPTLLDDTCYFLPCRTWEQASLLEATLNGPVALALVRSLAFPDAKRPITKALLQRINLRALLANAGLPNAWQDEWATDWVRPTRSSGVLESLDATELV